MSKDDLIKDTLRVRFHINEPELDIIALKIVWEMDRKLWENYVLKKFPIFNSIQAWDTKRIVMLLRQVYLDRQRELFQAQQNFVSYWSAVENRWYLFLEHIFELKIEKKAYFDAYIGIAPIFPRDLEVESFLVPLSSHPQDILKICAHETSHFFFYRKVKEINFVVQPDASHLWIVSELLVPLLFSDHRVIANLGQMPQSSYICQQSLIERCRKIYQKRLKEKINAENLIKQLLQVKIKAGELNEKFFN